MSPRTLAVLVALGTGALAGGWYFGVATEPTQERPADTGKLMFPGLIDQLGQVEKIEIVHQGRPTAIEKHGDIWGLVERDGYRVQETKLRGMLTALTELRLVEPRTSDSAKYPQLGVEEPDAKDKDGTSNLLRLINATGKPILAVIVGHRRVRTQGNVPEEVYVRRPSEAQSWLAEGSLQVDADPQLWLDRDIMNLDHTQIEKVVSVRGGATLAFARDNDGLKLQTPADHPKLDEYKLEDVSRALELLTFQDVHKSDEESLDSIGQSVFTTKDGMAITVTVFHHRAAIAGQADTVPPPDKDVWVRFAITGSDKNKAESERLTAKVNGWTYQIGNWKEKSLLPSIDALKAADHAPLSPGAGVPAGTGEGASTDQFPGDTPQVPLEKP